MVVQGILALALALPTGMLFGVGYGTGVRIGYEQVYPLLFPKDTNNRNVTPTVDNIKRLNNIYNTIGGKEASQMGIAQGLAGAMGEIKNNPDFQALEELELRLSGRTQSRLSKPTPSEETSVSDFPSGSSLDPKSPNFDPEYYVFVKKKEGDQPFPPNFDFGNKAELNTFDKLASAQLQFRKDKSVQNKGAYDTAYYLARDKKINLWASYKKRIPQLQKQKKLLPSRASFYNKQILTATRNLNAAKLNLYAWLKGASNNRKYNSIARLDAGRLYKTRAFS